MKNLKRRLLENDALGLRMVALAVAVLIMVIVIMAKFCEGASAAAPTDQVTFHVNNTQYRPVSFIEEPNILPGDVNGDGYITVVDIIYIRQYLAHMRDLSKESLAAADFNQDGRVSITDAAMLQRLLYLIKRLETAAPNGLGGFSFLHSIFSRRAQRDIL